MCDKYLLIIPCSKRKASLPKVRVPAIDLYDGPFYRIIRKTFRERGKPDNLDIMILSAKYGLIDYEKIITTYDQIMTREMAISMSDTVYEIFTNIIKRNNYKEIMINLGEKYMLALSKSHDILNVQRVRCGIGGIGERNRQLKEWLISVYRDRY